jgi:large subunit ribosomal protein L8e
MSKVIRKFRQIKKKNRIQKQYTLLSYPLVTKPTEGVVLDIFHESGKCAPVAVVLINNKKYNIAATEGLIVGSKILVGDHSEMKIGNITNLRNIPEGSSVHSVEYAENDGGKIAIIAGSFCDVVNHRRESQQTVIKLPSGVKKVLPSSARAVIGLVAGSGVTEKPILKASVAHYLHKARGQIFPKVRGVAMNPVDHAHGGGNHQHIGAPSTIAKTAPYAQQVGLIGARSTGRRTGSKKNK